MIMLRVGTHPNNPKLFMCSHPKIFFSNCLLDALAKAWLNSIELTTRSCRSNGKLQENGREPLSLLHVCSVAAT